MGDLPPLERQWSILQTLCARRFGATVRDLADEFGVSQKTIRRDLILLQNLGFPVTPETGTRGRNHWVADDAAGVPPLKFNVSELLALYLGRTLLEPLAGTIIWSSAHSAFLKIRATLGEAGLQYLDRLARLLHRTSFRDSRYSGKSQLIDDLMVAVEDRRITFLTYQSARSTEPLTYDVYPYGLIHHSGSLYLVAHSRQHDGIRTFKLDRVSNVALETLTFEKPQDFDLRAFLRDSLGIFHEDGPSQRVVIRFAAGVARYVKEHHWHASQQLIRESDGSLRLEMELSSLQEVKSWVLSFGAKAIVLEPEELRQAIEQDVKSLLRLYESDESMTSEPDSRRDHRAVRTGRTAE